MAPARPFRPNIFLRFSVAADLAYVISHLAFHRFLPDRR